MEIVEQFLQRSFITLGDDPHRSIGLIGYPPHKRQTVRFLQCRLAKKNALHQANNSGFQASLCIRTHEQIIQQSRSSAK